MTLSVYPNYSLQLVIPMAKFVVMAIFFGLAAVSDWVKREVNPLVWVPPIAVGVILNTLLAKPYMITIRDQLYEEVLTKHFYVSVTVSVILIAVLAVMSFVFGLIGGADVLALSSFVALYPSSTNTLALMLEKGIEISGWRTLLLIPPILAVLMMYLAIIIPYVIINVVHNILHLNEIKGYSIPLRRKILYLIIGRIVKVKDLAKRRFYYPIYVPGVVERITFNIDEDDTLWVDKLSTLEPDTAIIVTWGIPMVTFLSIAALLYAILDLVIATLTL